MSQGLLTFFCGKMGAGKSSKANEIARKANTVLFAEDEWLAAIYPKQISSLQDYITYSNQLKPQIKKTVQAILATGTHVVMDFPANTLAQREWFRSIFLEIQAPHKLSYIDLPNQVCLKQIEKRRVQQPERAATDTEAMFETVTKYFVAPRPEEGFNIVKLQQNL